MADPARTWEQEQPATGVSGTLTSPLMSRMDSLGMADAYFTMPLLTVVSSTNSTACAAHNTRCLCRLHSWGLPLCSGCGCIRGCKHRDPPGQSPCAGGAL